MRLALQLIDKFPVLNPAWSDEIKSRWFAMYGRLLEMGLSEIEAARLERLFHMNDVLRVSYRAWELSRWYADTNNDILSDNGRVRTVPGSRPDNGPSPPKAQDEQGGDVVGPALPAQQGRE